MTLPLVVLHGFTGGPESFRAVVDRLPREIDVFSPALIGHGRPFAAPSVAGFEGEVDRLASLLRPREHRSHLAGYSLGARIALGLLVRHPDLFDSATLIGGQPGLEREADRAERVASDERWCRILEEQGLAAFVEQWQALPLFASQNHLPGPVLAEQRAARLRHSPQGIALSLRVTGLGVMPSYWGALRHLQVPTTLLVGQDDDKFTAIARRMAAQMPRVNVETVAGAGHNVVLECPEAVARILRRQIEHPAAAIPVSTET